MLAFAGPGYLVAVGYMDPGNWATDLAAGSRHGYALLSVVLASSLLAMLLQCLAVRFGLATGRDLAAACRDEYSRRTAIALWVFAELAIVACDLAEVIGAAVALQMLFGLPLVWGVLITALDTFVVMILASRGYRWLEVLVALLIAGVSGCFVMEIAMAHPDWRGVAAGLAPSRRIFTDPEMLYLSIGILGATVMPHNLYLHSAIVHTRRRQPNAAGLAEAVRFSCLDTIIALSLAFFVNAAILVVASAAFHRLGRPVEELREAHQLLSPVLGAGAASFLFAIALLGSGQNSTLTGTLAGQIIMEGFLHVRLRPWMRRLVTRGLAIIPAAIVAGVEGDSAVNRLLVFSQVVLSFQLPFAVVPLVRMTGQSRLMGRLVSPRWLQALAWAAAALIIALNAKLVVDLLRPK
jgi:manganese transport protein